MAIPYCSRCKEYRKASDCAQCAQESMLASGKKRSPVILLRDGLVGCEECGTTAHNAENLRHTVACSMSPRKEPTHNPANDCAGSHHCLKEWMAKEPAEPDCPHCSRPHLCEGRSSMLFPKCVTNQRKQAEGVERAREALAEQTEAPAARDPVIPRNAPLAIRPMGNGFLAEPAYREHGRMQSDREVLVFESRKALLAFLLSHFDEPEPT